MSLALRMHFKTSTICIIFHCTETNISYCGEITLKVTPNLRSTWIVPHWPGHPHSLDEYGFLILRTEYRYGYGLLHSAPTICPEVAKFLHKLGVYFYIRRGVTKDFCTFFETLKLEMLWIISISLLILTVQ